MSKNSIYGVIAVISIALPLIGIYAVTKNTTTTSNTSSSSSSASMMMGKDGCPAGQSQKAMPGMCMMDSSVSTDTSMSMNGGMMMGMSMSDMVVSEKSFLQEMIPHHQEAVDSSNKLLANTEDQDLKKFGVDVVAAQTKEISEMKSWYKQWYGSEYKGSTATSMMGSSANLTGKDLDKWYIRGMIEHHQGAIDMAKKVLTFGNLMRETKTLANTIISSQSSEISLLKTWLVTKF